MKWLARKLVSAAVKRERKRILHAFDQLASSYDRNAEFHRRNLPQVAEIESLHADHIRRVICVFGESNDCS